MTNPEEVEEMKWERAAQLAMAMQDALAQAQRSGLQVSVDTVVRSLVLQLEFAVTHAKVPREVIEQLMKEAPSSRPGQALAASAMATQKAGDV